MKGSDRIMGIARCVCGNEFNVEFEDNEQFKMVRCSKCNSEMKFRNPNYVEGKDTQQVADDMARMMNYRLHAQCLFVPVLNDFQVQNDNNPQTIVLASGHGFCEQLTSDGYIEDGKFEERIELVINNAKRYMRNHGCENADDSFIYYKDYNNGVFNFKIYVQDMIINAQDGKKVIRTMIAYFVEPTMHDFYQLSLGVGPFAMPTELLKLGTIDLEQDQITMSLDNLMKTLLDNLRYRD